MGLRDQLNERPVISTVVALALVGLALWLVMRYRWGEQAERDALAAAIASGAGTSYFTIDDGASYFEDLGTNLPPYEKNGETAYGAAVYRCGDGEPFVAYMTRYSPEYREMLLLAHSGRAMNGGQATMMMRLESTGIEVKRPGQAEWVIKPPAFLGPRSGPGARPADPSLPTVVTCPDGQTPVEVLTESRAKRLAPRSSPTAPPAPGP
jgi:hypothetical protein